MAYLREKDLQPRFLGWICPCPRCDYNIQPFEHHDCRTKEQKALDRLEMQGRLAAIGEKLRPEGKA